MRRLGMYLLGAAVGGCGFHVPGGQVVGDAGPDAMADAVDGHLIDVPQTVCGQWDPHHFDPCMIPAPTMALDLMTAGIYVLDTGLATLTPPTGAPIPLVNFSTNIDPGSSQPISDLISVHGLNVGVGVTLRVIGSKPLIVASWGQIAVSGVIDIGSHLVMSDPAPPELITTISAGAGANPVTCAGRAPTTGADGTSGTGGGGGGGNRGVGGAGGQGDTPTHVAGGLGGGAVATPPTIVYGGCSGATSGRPGSSGQTPSTPTTTSPGGPGGGAIQLTARGGMMITGTITAGGAGGGGAQRNSANGGGGGGAGGFIGLEAPNMLLNNGTLAANGGGGGSSSRFSILERSHEGQDGKPSAVVALGGTPENPCSLQAPSGSIAGNLAGGAVPSTDTCDCGGAGGGGGAGFILVWGTLTKGGTTIISPPEQTGPP